MFRPIFALVLQMHMMLDCREYATRRSDGVSWPVVFEFASFQHLHVLVPCCCNNSAAESVWGVDMPFREMVPTTWRIRRSLAAGTRNFSCEG